MSDVNTFIDAIGKDINATVTPRIDGLVNGIEQQAVSDYGPRISAFASQLVKEIVDEQSVVVNNFVATLIQDLFARYRRRGVVAGYSGVVEDPDRRAVTEPHRDDDRAGPRALARMWVARFGHLPIRLFAGKISAFV